MRYAGSNKHCMRDATTPLVRTKGSYHTARHDLNRCPHFRHRNPHPPTPKNSKKRQKTRLEHRLYALLYRLDAKPRRGTSRHRACRLPEYKKITPSTENIFSFLGNGTACRKHRIHRSRESCLLLTIPATTAKTSTHQSRIR